MHFWRSFVRLARRPITRQLHASSSHEFEDFGNYQVILPQEPFVWGTPHIRSRPVPKEIHRPVYATKRSKENDPYHGDPYEGDGIIPLGGHEELRLRNAALLAKEAREHARSIVRPGITTNEIDASVHEYIIARSAYPSPLQYAGFPRSCCTSVNNIIAHGIPDDRPLENGDIVNVDVTVFLRGYHGDTSATFLVGDVDEKGKDLVRATKDALAAGIKACGPGQHFKGIGKAIYNVAHSRGFSVNTQFTGHGIGTVFHRPPWIVHTLNDDPGVMLPGHCFTIEPCLVQGSRSEGWIFPDGWTTSTMSCARSAQAEHMILVTESSIDVLTV